jgi:hypothetical protein
MNASRVLWINGAHVVTTDELDSASGGPSLGTTVAKDPGLLKDTIWWENSAIWYSVTNEESD